VIVAEDITSRFLNVISLFNGMIPLMAIQMNALKIGDQVGLVFTTVLDQVSLCLVEEDEEIQEVADRAYWENRANKKTVALADELLDMAKKLDSDLEGCYRHHTSARSIQYNILIKAYSRASVYQRNIDPTTFEFTVKGM